MTKKIMFIIILMFLVSVSIYIISCTPKTSSPDTTNTTSDSTTTTLYYENMVQISAVDSFTMGDGTYGPNVQMSLNYNFKMSKYEVTNSWYSQAMVDGLYSNSTYWTTNGWSERQTNSWTQPKYWTYPLCNGSDKPVVGVSWYEAVAFCNWLSIKQGKNAVYQSSGAISSLTANGYRLPTEVEWEYVCAKGVSGTSERIYAYGDTWACENSVCSVSPCSTSQTANVGSKPSGNTPQGICDMGGNVWEWLSDQYQITPVSGSNRYYCPSSVSNSVYVCYRGAGYFDTLTYLYLFRAANRDDYYYPNLRCETGFRVVLP